MKKRLIIIIAGAAVFVAVAIVLLHSVIGGESRLALGYAKSAYNQSDISKLLGGTARINHSVEAENKERSLYVIDVQYNVTVREIELEGGYMYVLLVDGAWVYELTRFDYGDRSGALERAKVFIGADI